MDNQPNIGALFAALYIAKETNSIIDLERIRNNKTTWLGSYENQIRRDIDKHISKYKRSRLNDFKLYCTYASQCFADDTGKEWRTAQGYADKAKNIASANPEYMAEYLEILKDQLVSQGDIFGY